MIIGIGGEKEVGKDTAAQVLLDQYGFVRLALADPLKDMCAEVFNIDVKNMHDSLEKERKFDSPVVANGYHVHSLISISNRLGIRPTAQQAQKLVKTLSGKSFSNIRELLQFVGTDVMRASIADNYWIDLFLSQIKRFDKVVVPDVRFPNERKLIQKTLGGKLIRVYRSGKSSNGHASETSLGDDKEYDLILQNNGTISDLHTKMQYEFRKLNDIGKHRA